MTDYSSHVEKLSNTLAADKQSLLESEGYLDSSYRIKTIGIGTPPEMRDLRVDVGWPSLYLRAIEERLDIEGFRINGESDEESEKLWEWWQDNNLDEESSLGHMDALTFGRSYITVAAPGPEDEDFPLIRLESPHYMFAEINPRTRKIDRAVRLYKTSSDSADADQATLYLPNETVLLKRNPGSQDAWITDGNPIKHDLGIVPVVPITNRGKLSNRYGASEITPEIRSLTDAACRALMNLQAASELMAVPLRVFFGVDGSEIAGNGTRAEINEAYYARILALQNETGKAFEFSAADLRNFVEELSELGKHVASYTGLPPQYLSFSSENPASAEAILATESRLIKTCERKARMFGGSWEQAMRVARLIMKQPKDPKFRRLETVWSNPATPTYAAKADAATKAYAAGSGVIPKEQARIDMGYTVAQRKQQKEWDIEDRETLTALGPILNPGPVAKPTSKPAPKAA